MKMTKIELDINKITFCDCGMNAGIPCIICGNSYWDLTKIKKEIIKKGDEQ